MAADCALACDAYFHLPEESQLPCGRPLWVISGHLGLYDRFTPESRHCLTCAELNRTEHGYHARRPRAQRALCEKAGPALAPIGGEIATAKE
jgi:hypothetical protein